MSLNIQKCNPITVILDSSDATLATIKTIIPSAIEIVTKYTHEAQTRYRVLVPYKFTMVRAPQFGDRLELSLNLGLEYSATEGEPLPEMEILAQDVNYIKDYYH